MKMPNLFQRILKSKSFDAAFSTHMIHESVARGTQLGASANSYLNIDNQTYENLYNNIGIIHRIINTIADECLREWIKIDSDLEYEINTILQRKKIKRFLKTAIIQARIYGASIIILNCFDNKTLDMECNWHKIKDFSINSIVPYLNNKTGLRNGFTIKNMANMRSEHEIEHYIISNNGTQTEIHKTRAFLIKNSDTLSTSLIDSISFSPLQPIIDPLKNYVGCSQNILKILETMSITTLIFDFDKRKQRAQQDAAYAAKI